MEYLRFILKEKRLLTFGVSFTFISSFGQTFFISLFVPDFLDYFSLSNAMFGSIYSGATLVSATLLPFTGRLIDHIPLRKYSLFVCLGLMAALLIGAISWHVVVLFIALLMVRHFGQGLSGHTAQTAMARFYDMRRGKALSISSLGYPIGEGILPIIITGLLTLLDWRWIWVALALIILSVYTPSIQWLLKHSDLVKKSESEIKENRSSSTDKNAYITVLSDFRFWVILPTLIGPPFWGTALLLYQISIAEQFGWTVALIASAFIFFAISRVISSFLIGPAIDRFTAEKLLPFYSIPLVFGLLMVYLPLGNWAAFAYMAFIGITMGTAPNVNSALWAEWYGREVIGTVRSLFATLMVLSTAASPAIMGWLLDAEVALSSIILVAILTTVGAIILSFLSWLKRGDELEDL